MRIIDNQLKKWTIDNLYNLKGHLNRNKTQKAYFERHNLKSIYDSIMEIKIEANLSSFIEALYWLKNDIVDPPLCVCGKRIKFNRVYNKTCGDSCCRTRSQEATSLDKYGVTNYTKTIEHKNTLKLNQSNVNKKRQNTNLEKYGVENPFQNNDIKAKIKATNLKKYGVENPMKNKLVSSKVVVTQTEKYGGMANSSITISNKIKATNLEKYGVENPFQNNGIKAKIKATNLKNYKGVGFNSQEISNKIKSTNLEKYGVEQITQRHLCNLQYWDDKKFIIDSFVDINGVVDRTGFMEFFNCSLFGFYSKMRTLGISYKQIQSFGENEVFKIIKCDDKIQSDRTILDGKELDIYIPSKKLAIEYNGIYWHSELNGKDKNYHLNKTLLCEEQDIQLLHIFETEWLEKRQIVQSIINAKLGEFKTRIYARKTTIKELSSKEKSIFLDNNHIQGNDKSSVRIGLFYENVLVSIMTFGKSRYNKSFEYEMHRYCTLQNHQIVGGASKLWKYFITHHNPSSVITYADRRFSDGSFYEKIGFIKSHVSPPNHFYFKGNSGLMSRIGWQKHKLSGKLKNFDSTITAWKNMQLHGYDRIYDCGNYVFVWRKS